MRNYLDWLRFTSFTTPPVSIILMILAIVFSLVIKRKDVGIRFWERLPSGIRVLLVFVGVVMVFGVVASITYWTTIQANAHQIIYAVGLFLAMVFGMFVRVLAGNRQQGRPFFTIDPAALLFPLLFSLVVFYPIWALVAQSPSGLFPVHAAFLNGYFWESIVSGIRPPTTGGGGGGASGVGGAAAAGGSATAVAGASTTP